MNTWSIPLDRLAQKTGLRLETVARKVTFDLFKSVALKSPVDTGRFRANWNVSYGSPDISISASTNKGRADSEARKATTLPVGGVIYMSNGLPYARRLENGWSDQAPSGMVRLSVREFAFYVNRAIR